MKIIFYLIIGTMLTGCNTINGSFENEQPDAVLNPAPFSRGINFSQWFEADSAQTIQFTRYKEQDFINVKSMGADVIRLPVRMHSMTLGAPQYVLDPLLLKFLDTAVDWAEKHRLYIIIDNHSFDPSVPTDENIDGILLKVWAQIAARYKNRSKYVVYEILNEPHGISDSRWGTIQGAAIDTIRKIDTTHAIIAGGTDYNSVNKLDSIPEYSDPNLIYTFHFYDPYLFTHQGATWGGAPTLESLAGLPFPAAWKSIPKTPSDLKGTWVEDALKNYKTDAAFSALAGSLDKAVAFSRQREAPVFCGEFGVYMVQSPAKDRVKWYKFISGALERRNIARASWDYFGGFGIFNDTEGRDFHTDVNTAVVSAMGFIPPPQRTRKTGPLGSGFVMYGDYPNRDVSMGYSGEDAFFSMYDTGASEGEYAVRWGNAGRYDTFRIEFERNGDFSRLATEGYCLEFRARATSPADKPVRFDVRFVNRETAASVPWRMRYTINEKILPADGKWRVIRVPLAGMTEQGAWVNATRKWLDPQGKFSWKNVKQLDFVSEDGDLKNCNIWFDSIKIVKP